MTTPVNSRHVHFADDQATTSHRPPEDFRRNLTSNLRLRATQAGNIVSGIASVARNVAVNARAIAYGLRKEIPFERWFYHYGLNINISDAEISEKIKARAWALFAFGESLLQSAASLAQFCFAKIFNHPEEQHLNKLKALGISIGFSAAAVVSPENAVTAASSSDGNTLCPIGRHGEFGDFTGTLYTGD